MAVSTVYTQQTSTDEAIREIKEKAGNIIPKLVLFFASSCYEAESLSTAIKEAFADAEVIGCSTAGEIISGHVLKKSLVVMLLDEETMKDAKVEVIKDIKSNLDVEPALKSFENYYKTPILGMDITEYVGLILIDGLSGAEEAMMESIGDRADVLFIGGSAGDDLDFKKTYVYANGKTYTDAAVLALCKPTKGYEILKTQSFCSLKKKLIATKVNEATRTVIEFNEKPALQKYAEALGVSVEQATKLFMRNPVGLMAGDEPFVRSPQQAQDQEMIFYCNIKEGMELDLLESQDIVKDTKADLDAKLKEVGEITAIINFHCILRTLELEKKGQTEDYGNLFTDIPTIGFSTYGEEYLGHVNQTSTILLIK